MLRVGLTGGIGCGKSTVAAMMQNLGCQVLSADKIAHRLIEPGQPAYDEIIRDFGEEILTGNRSINRKLLAEMVFSDHDRLAQLNAIIHPRVLAEEDLELARIERADPRAVGIVEAALLVESGFYRRLDRLVVVWCRADQQLERLTNPRFGRGMSPEEARKRILAQLDIEEKRKVANDLIDSSGSIEDTQRQVTELVARLKALSAARADGRR